MKKSLCPSWLFGAIWKTKDFFTLTKKIAKMNFMLHINNI